MKLKMIAVDMDGTFLNDESTYDRERFLKDYEQLKERGIHFVVASGNPYIQLQGSFGEEARELTYIAENGAYVVDQGKELFLASISKQNVKQIIEELYQHQDVLCWVCTKNQSYALSSMPEQYFQSFLPYFPGVKKVERYEDIQEDILKFALFFAKWQCGGTFRNFFKYC